MKLKFFRIAKIAGMVLLLLIATFLVLMGTGVIWRSPAYYHVGEIKELEKPVMSMEKYRESAGHKRPYNYYLKNEQGEVYILGIDHTKDPNNPQIDTISRIWDEFQPDVVLVEGRLGFLFSWLQDPVKNYGESGKAVYLAKKDDVEVYTWEPQKQDEVKLMLKNFSPEKVALFYSLRPYLSNFRFGKPDNTDEVMESYIKSRTDENGIRGKIKFVAQIDSMWAADFPAEKDWRESSDQYGWPKGYLSEMASFSNEIRNLHQCSAILELVEKGKKVMVVMGSSHAFRIEEALRSEFKQSQPAITKTSGLTGE